MQEGDLVFPFMKVVPADVCMLHTVCQESLGNQKGLLRRQGLLSTSLACSIFPAMSHLDSAFQEATITLQIRNSLKRGSWSHKHLRGYEKPY